LSILAVPRDSKCKEIFGKQQRDELTEKKRFPKMKIVSNDTFSLLVMSNDICFEEISHLNRKETKQEKEKQKHFQISVLNHVTKRSIIVFI
jgi:hypothetical protein